jgi:hypothetical protein
LFFDVVFGPVETPGFFHALTVYPITHGTSTPSLMPWIFFLSAGTMVAKQPPKVVSPSLLVKK